MAFVPAFARVLAECNVPEPFRVWLLGATMINSQRFLLGAPNNVDRDLIDVCGINLTIGEKIGKQGMTYAQGMSAQITTATMIGFANIFALPVSTTHVLSSGVAGTMVANKSGLQGGTVKIILMAWILTLPATVGLSAGLFWLVSKALGS